MIEFRLADLLKERGWTAYHLAKQSGLTIPTAYRLADKGQEFGRLSIGTLDRLCAALEVQPGALLRWVPDQES